MKCCKKKNQTNKTRHSCLHRIRHFKDPTPIGSKTVSEGHGPEFDREESLDEKFIADRGIKQRANINNRYKASQNKTTI